MSPDKSIDIFLSYSRSDTKLMNRLRNDLQKAGFSVWIDQNSLKPGTDSWQRAVESAINDARCLIVILSPGSKQSRWVENEVSSALDLGLLIIPLLAKGDERNAVPFSLKTTNWIDLRNNKYQSGVCDKLIPTLQEHLQRPGRSEEIIYEADNVWKRVFFAGVISAVILGILVMIAKVPLYAFIIQGFSTNHKLVVSQPISTPTAMAANTPTSTELPEPTAIATPSSAIIISWDFGIDTGQGKVYLVMCGNPNKEIDADNGGCITGKMINSIKKTQGAASKSSLEVGKLYRVCLAVDNTPGRKNGRWMACKDFTAPTNAVLPVNFSASDLKFMR